jgi:hypothetical protein
MALRLLCGGLLLKPFATSAERGDSVSLMYLQPSGSGAKYHGRNETFWERQGEALITWG